MAGLIRFVCLAAAVHAATSTLNLEFRNLVIDNSTRELWVKMRERMFDRGAFVVAGSDSGLSVTEARAHLAAEAEAFARNEDPASSNHPAESLNLNLLQRGYVAESVIEHHGQPVARNPDLNRDPCAFLEESGFLKMARHCRVMHEFGCMDHWDEMVMIESLGDTRRHIQELVGKKYSVTNPVLRIWCDWAKDAQYSASHDASVLGGTSGLIGFALRNTVILSMFSYGVPSKHVLRKILQISKGKITDVGGYPGYWARLLATQG